MKSRTLGPPINEDLRHCTDLHLVYGVLGVLDGMWLTSTKSPHTCALRPHGRRLSTSQHRRCSAKAGFENPTCSPTFARNLGSRMESNSSQDARNLNVGPPSPDFDPHFTAFSEPFSSILSQFHTFPSAPIHLSFDKLRSVKLAHWIAGDCVCLASSVCSSHSTPPSGQGSSS